MIGTIVLTGPIALTGTSVFSGTIVSGTIVPTVTTGIVVVVTSAQLLS